MTRTPDVDDMAAINKGYYDRPEVADGYARPKELFPAEAAILARHDAGIRGKRVLDLGVGGGRTTAFFLPLAGTYVGIDYSEEMLDRCRRRFPDADLRLCDARRLDVFDDGAFNLIAASYSVLDEVPPADRGRILREIRRLLPPRGLFFFSAHNLGAVAASPFVQRAPDHLPAEGHAIVEEMFGDHRLPTYYVTREAQIAELSDLGFCDVEVVDYDGRLLARDAPCADVLVFYVARRA